MNPFEILGLQWGLCTEADVIKAYRKLALDNHPDKAGSTGLDRMKSINAARDRIIQGKLCSRPPPARRLSREQPPHTYRPNERNWHDQSQDEQSREEDWQEARRRERRPREEQRREDELKDDRRQRDELREWVRRREEQHREDQRLEAQRRVEQEWDEKAFGERPWAQQSRRKPPQTQMHASRDDYFWEEMPFLMDKIATFLNATMPRDPSPGTTPWHTIRDLHDDVNERLRHSAGPRSLFQICRLIGSMFFAIKQLRRDETGVFPDWSLRHTMSKVGWCKYDDREKIVMRRWLSLCMPEIEAQWRDKDSKWRDKGIWVG